MNLRRTILAITALLALTANALAVTLAKGTSVILAFDQGFSSRTAHKGDRIRLHVVNDVSVGRTVVIHQGAAVTLTITEVQKSGRFGKNGQIKMAIDPIRTRGAKIPLQPRQKGNMIGGKMGTEGAGATVGGALILGPIGLGAGYFVVGQSVTVKKGDRFETQVSEDVRIG